MKTLVGMLGFFAVFMSLGAAAIAASKPQDKKDNYYNLCSESDLVGGTWKMMTLKETPKRKEASWFEHIPYHYIAFYPRNQYSFVATQREVKRPVDLQRLLQWPENQKHVLQYALDNQGVLNLYMDKKVTYSYRCLVVTKNKAEYMKGDLILTGYTMKARTRLYKLYRRWF